MAYMMSTVSHGVRWSNTPIISLLLATMASFASGAAKKNSRFYNKSHFMYPNLIKKRFN